MLLEHVLEEVLDLVLEVRLVLVGLEYLRELAELLGYDGVEQSVRAGDVVRRADHTELEAVACECERRRSVAVGRILRERRESIHAYLEILCLGLVDAVLLDSLQHRVKLLAEEH